MYVYYEITVTNTRVVFHDGSIKIALQQAIKNEEDVLAKTKQKCLWQVVVNSNLPPPTPTPPCSNIHIILGSGYNIKISVQWF